MPISSPAAVHSDLVSGHGVPYDLFRHGFHDRFAGCLRSECHQPGMLRCAVQEWKLPGRIELEEVLVIGARGNRPAGSGDDRGDHGRQVFLRPVRRLGLGRWSISLPASGRESADLAPRPPQAGPPDERGGDQGDRAQGSACPIGGHGPDAQMAQGIGDGRRDRARGGPDGRRGDQGGVT